MGGRGESGSVGMGLLPLLPSLWFPRREIVWARREPPSALPGKEVEVIRVVGVEVVNGRGIGRVVIGEDFREGRGD